MSHTHCRNHSRCKYFVKWTLVHLFVSVLWHFVLCQVFQLQKTFALETGRNYSVKTTPTAVRKCRKALKSSLHDEEVVLIMTKPKKEIGDFHLLNPLTTNLNSVDFCLNSPGKLPCKYLGCAVAMATETRLLLPPCPGLPVGMFQMSGVLSVPVPGARK